MTQDQSNGTDKGTSAGGKPDLTVMDVMELMRHGGPDLVAEECERRIRMGADPLHTVLGAKAHDKLIERATKLREDCAPQAIIMMIEELCDEAAGDDIPAFLKKAPPVGETSMTKAFARGGYVPAPEGGFKAELHQGGESVMPKPKLLGEASVEDLLNALRYKGGTFRAVADAQLLVLKKSNDYNRSALDVAEQHAARDIYFPFGHASYAQMHHVKSQRINSLVDAELKGRATNFEGLKDTALDLINYASFLVERISRED